MFSMSLTPDIHTTYLQEYADILARGGIGILPTDTIYGVVASALNPEAVERVYTVKNRDMSKACIVLISSLEDLALFGSEVSETLRTQLVEYWPGPVSIILPFSNDSFTYLHRGNNSLAFRMPAGDALQAFLKTTGPLIAPSANPEGQPHARTITDAQKYFDSSVDFYADRGALDGKASKLISFDENGRMHIVR